MLSRECISKTICCESNSAKIFCSSKSTIHNKLFSKVKASATTGLNLPGHVPHAQAWTAPSLSGTTAPHPLKSLSSKIAASMLIFQKPGSVCGVQRESKLWYSTVSFDDGVRNSGAVDDDFIPEKREAIPQGVDPSKGWHFRGVHKAIICGKVRQTPVQKLLRTGRTLTIFNVGTGGMWDHRVLGAKDLPKPAQWHRVVVHNESLGAYAVQQLVKNSSVYIEGDIELRVYNKGITGEVVKLPEICVRNDGKVRLIKTGESTTNIPFEELREGLL